MYQPSAVMPNDSVSGWQPTPARVLLEALKFAEVGPQDLLFDLGCGDGRVIVKAARLFGAQAVGFDIDPQLLQETRRRIRRLGLHDYVRARRQSMTRIPDLHRATVIFLFLPQTAVNRLKPIILRNCRKGTRVVSVASRFPNWLPDKQMLYRGRQATWWMGLWYV